MIVKNYKFLVSIRYRIKRSLHSRFTLFMVSVLYEITIWHRSVSCVIERFVLTITTEIVEGYVTNAASSVAVYSIRKILQESSEDSLGMIQTETPSGKRGKATRRFVLLNLFTTTSQLLYSINKMMHDVSKDKT